MTLPHERDRTRQRYELKMILQKHSSTVALILVLTGPAWSADDPGERAIQQLQLQRQQQQEQLQLKMQQYQRNSVNPPADAGQREAIEQLQLDQSLQQQQLQMNEQRASASTCPEIPSDDPGTREAKTQIELQRGRQESQRQLQQFDLSFRTGGRRPKRGMRKARCQVSADRQEARWRPAPSYRAASIIATTRVARTLGDYRFTQGFTLEKRI